jgi:hypothetical protein
VRRESVSKPPVVVESPFEEKNGLGSELGPNDEKEVFNMIERPRVRYDVEVVTKLVVYCGKYYVLDPGCWMGSLMWLRLILFVGIGLFAVELVPLVYELVGLAGTPVR